MICQWLDDVEYGLSALLKLRTHLRRNAMLGTALETLLLGSADNSALSYSLFLHRLA